MNVGNRTTLRFNFGVAQGIALIVREIQHFNSFLTKHVYQFRFSQWICAKLYMFYVLWRGQEDVGASQWHRGLTVVGRFDPIDDC